jgi:outer membrane receptor protein involved in Fe transport
MKNGYSAPGFRALGSSGSFARTRGVVEYGSVFDDIAVYEGIGALYDGGFRDHSHSHGVQFYADARHAERRYELAANLTVVADSLRGNGPIPVDQLARDRSAVYTWPDITNNALVLLSSQGDVQLDDWLSLQTTAYVRHLGRQTLNGDEAEFVACDGRDALCSEDSDRALRDEHGRVLPAAAASDAVLHTTDTSTASYGGTLQTTWGRPVAQHDQQLIVGASASGAGTDFDQHAQLASLTDDREVTGGTAYLGGAAYRTALASHDLRAGLYATDTFAITSALHLTMSARLNHARIALEDQLGRALDGTHHFTRLNPAAGLAYRLPYGMSVFGGYTESSRAPTAAELACADPSEPCRVPNAFLSDPALHQVVGRSVELGVRGRERIAGRSYLRWAVAGFATRNHDDILFVAGSHVGTGYFRNAGDTQRAGFEANVEGRVGFVEWFASYQFLRATFEDALTLPGVNNPRARIDSRGRPVLDVQAGDHLPGMPANSLKLGFTLIPLPGLRIGPQARYASSQYFRGDEANLLDPLGGYFVLDAHASYRVLPWLMLFVDAENLLDARYQTFGILGQASEVLPYAKDPRFVGIGAPLGVWGGVEVDL